MTVESRQFDLTASRLELSDFYSIRYRFEIQLTWSFEIHRDSIWYVLQIYKINGSAWKDGTPKL